jgi:hypothetical protein
MRSSAPNPNRPRPKIIKSKFVMLDLKVYPVGWKVQGWALYFP